MARIVINNLTKSTNDISILKSVNLCVEKGEVCALIGPNGAGKTTLINCLLGLVMYEQGSIEINRNLLKDDTVSEVLSQIGSVLQYPASISHITIEQLFDDHFHYLNLKKPESWDGYLRKVKLHISPSFKIGKMSLGMKQRLLLGMAISHEPNILILDEPFNGLDPDGMFLIKDIITAFKNSGGSVLIASHSLGELEDFVTSVVLIKDGKTFEKKNIEAILGGYSGGLQEYYKQFWEDGDVIE